MIETERYMSPVWAEREYFHMKKQVLIHAIAALTVVCMLCGSLMGCGTMKTPFIPSDRAVMSQEVYTFGSYTYQLYDDDTVLLVDYSGNETNLVIPDTIDGKTVTGIGNGTFLSNTAIQSVKLNKSLETIEAYAFCACTSLTQVTFGTKIWRIGEMAFEETPWLVGQTDDFVVVGDSVLIKYQGKSNDVVIPDGIKHISSAFGAHSSLVSVEMGADVLTVGDYAFAYTPTLRRVILGENVTCIGNYAFDGCTYLPNIRIPDRVETIGNYAFNDCNYLVEISLGSSLREIGQYAFKYCSRLMSVTMPATVERIASYAFADCYSLTLVYYGGTQEQFDALGLEGSNVHLKEAHIIYESNGGLR